MDRPVGDSATESLVEAPTLLQQTSGEVFEWVSPVDALVEKHRWTGGYSCKCGAEMNSPQTWSRHVLEDAWEVFTRIGVDAARASGITVLSPKQFDQLMSIDGDER